MSGYETKPAEMTRRSVGRMKTLGIVVCACAAAASGAHAGTAADHGYIEGSPYVYGFHFWALSAYTTMSGKTGWACECESVWDLPAINETRYGEMVSTGFTPLVRINNGYGESEGTIPLDPSDFPAFASMCAYWAERLYPYITHVWVLGNELGHPWEGDFTVEEYVDCFMQVRQKLHEVNPCAKLSPGGQNHPEFNAVLYDMLGEWADAYCLHGIVDGIAAEIDQELYRKCKNKYITEWGVHPYYEENIGQIQNNFAILNNYNNQHTAKVECACWYVYNKPWTSWHNLTTYPLAVADWTDTTATTSYTNTYLIPETQTSNVALAGIDDNSANVTWNTDHYMTGQVEYWPVDDPTQRFITPYVNTLHGSHSVTIGDEIAPTGGLLANREYDVQLKCYQAIVPLARRYTVTWPYRLKFSPPGRGTIEGGVEDADGGVAGATVSGWPAALASTSADDGSYDAVGIIPNTYDLTCEKAGYAQARAYDVAVSTSSAAQADFRLAPVDNLLVNGGFEDGATGWQNTADLAQGPWYFDIMPHGGDWFMGCPRNWGTWPTEGATRQMIASTPGRSYQMKAWVLTYHHNNPGIEVEARIGIDPLAETDPNSASIVWSDWLRPEWPNNGEWIELSTPAVTAQIYAMTVFLHHRHLGEKEWFIAAFDDVGVYCADRVGSAAEASRWDTGWNLVSVPLARDDASIERAFSGLVEAGNDLTNAVFLYDQGTGYSAYPAVTDIDAGAGCWVHVTTPAYCSVTGVDAADPFEIPLADGWTLLGSPHDGPVPLADCSVTDGATTLTWAEAVSSGWVQNVAYYYDGGGYMMLAASGGDDDALRPWIGYWFYAALDGLSLLAPAP